jgi:hypothetical protein
VDEGLTTLRGQSKFSLLFCYSRNIIMCVEGDSIIEVGIISRIIQYRELYVLLS